MTALEQAIRTALLDFVWQGVVVAFLLWMALFAMRKRSANARYIASCLALFTLVGAAGPDDLPGIPGAGRFARQRTVLRDRASDGGRRLEWIGRA